MNRDNPMNISAEEIFDLFSRAFEMGEEKHHEDTAWEYRLVKVGEAGKEVEFELGRCE